MKDAEIWWIFRDVRTYLWKNCWKSLRTKLQGSKWRRCILSYWRVTKYSHWSMSIWSKIRVTSVEILDSSGDVIDEERKIGSSYGLVWQWRSTNWNSGKQNLLLTGVRLYYLHTCLAHNLQLDLCSHQWSLGWC